MYKLIVTSNFETQLDIIVRYISDNLKSPIAATNFLDDIFKCYEHLENSPQIYECCRDNRLNKMGYRRAIVNNYVIIYRIDEKNNIVYILHIFYGKRDYEKLI